MAGLIERSLLLGLGVLTLTRDKVNQLVDKLVEEGEVKAEEAPSVVDRLVARGEAEREEMRRLIREELDKVRAGVPVASHMDIEELGQKVDDLAARIDDLAGKKPAKKQTD
jgi:polyhydroxyalkanoate synthesis regulator phasin